MQVGGASPKVCLALLAMLLAATAGAENVDPDNDGSQYAWAENVGWISAEQDTDGDGVPDQGIQVEDFRATGWLWGENIGWISLSCLDTGSCGRVRYVVRNNGNGELTGWGWSENLGWISFSCANTASCDEADYGVVVDVTTGEFSGHAWGENVGWIRFDFEDPGVRPYRIRSAWNCDPPPAPPEGTPELLLGMAGEEARLSWTAPPGATGYDVVLGDLDILRISGDFRAATEGCAGNRYPATVLFDATEVAPGEGVWFLVRGINCGGGASYDTEQPTQVGSRDVEIEASGNGCY